MYTKKKSSISVLELDKEDVQTKYDLECPLVERTTSKACVGTNRATGELVYVKCFLTGPMLDPLEFTTDKIKAWKMIQHPNIARLIDIFENSNHVSLVMELAEGDYLFDRITKVGTFTEKDASGIMYQVLDAVACLHDAGIVHKDIQQENLLYKTTGDDSKIMLSNFRLSKSDAERETCGLPTYTAPERFKRGFFGNLVPYGNADDVWSIGIIAYILLCRYPPFYAEHVRDVVKQIQKAELEFASPFWNDISLAAKCFVRQLLDKRPKKRYTCRQALQDPWVCGEAADTKNIQETVSTNLKEYFGKEEGNVASSSSEMPR